MLKSFSKFINESSSPKLEVEDLNSLLPLGLIGEKEYLLQLSDALVSRGTPLQGEEFLESMPIILAEMSDDFNPEWLAEVVRRWRGPREVRAVGVTGEIFDTHSDLVIFVSNGDRIHLRESFSGYASTNVDLHHGAKSYRLPGDIINSLDDRFEGDDYYHNLFNEAVNLAH